MDGYLISVMLFFDSSNLYTILSPGHIYRAAEYHLDVLRNHRPASRVTPNGDSITTTSSLDHNIKQDG